MTPEQRAKLRELHQKATQGEWRRFLIGANNEFDINSLDGPSASFVAGECSAADSDFIVAAHNALPGLLDELDAADKEIAELNRSISHTSNREEKEVRKWLQTQFVFTFTQRKNLSSDGNFFEQPVQYRMVDEEECIRQIMHALGLARVAEENAKDYRDKLAMAESEIARLKAGGCARDQRTTQHCAEAAALAAENKRLKEALERIKNWRNSDERDDWEGRNAGAYWAEAIASEALKETT